ncbi:hypothetical protein MSAN_01751100 [Mycena sanguinolenta]|uniref:CxC1-like cysteine cluster associated with KDZ transposases domain-containing protein n=1 Tax=Mycena sanguinolenta TaxID=230812 RepID=A0A8H6XXC7_9AGAR|nr:hypothetical protein MSAN_01751100 [Mycena sanguinolenta]
MSTSSRRNRFSATSASSSIHIAATERNVYGRIIKKRRTLTAAQILVAKEEEARREAERRASLSEKQRRAEDRLWEDIADPLDNESSYEDEVLRGRIAADFSNAGEAVGEEQLRRSDQELLEELKEHHHRLNGRPPDRRTRRDRTQLQVNAFAAQLERMTDAYIEWSLSVAERGLGCDYALPAEAVVQDSRRVLVVDIFTAVQQDLHLIRGDGFVASACIRQGWMPVSPYFPTVMITIRVLEIYRVSHLRCPRLGIQAFVRALADLHGVAPRPWLARQFTVAFDIYLAILARVEKRVHAALGRDTPNWRLKNACPACLYKLEGESPIKLPILMTMDGNNSLSRFELREREVYTDGTAVPGASRKRNDARAAPGDYYLSRAEVDKWAKEGLEDLIKTFDAGEGGAEQEEEEGSGCEERWQNMKEAVTTRAWGMYDETGIFPALCRHGFVLVVADMVKSGELTKYGFAVTAHLIEVLGELATGYDVGCKYGKMVKAHPVLGKLATDNRFISLVGAFHGPGHGRGCQLEHLTTYVEGVGMEPLEGCEPYFSKSNALASTTRHATRFHRQQAIVSYMKHTDKFETYHGLCELLRLYHSCLTRLNVAALLCNKYRRALETLSTEPALRDAMRKLRVESRSEFEQWLAKEKAHLRGLSKEPVQETLDMEYYQKLVNLADVECVVHCSSLLARTTCTNLMPIRARVSAALGAEQPFVAESDAGYAEAVKATRKLETQRRHLLEQQTKALAAVQDLEIRLGVSKRWVAGDEQWAAAAELVRKRRYRRALDNLERLIISRMFELSKCNMSGTGYKLRKHIAKALQARSKALRTAIARYNEAADAMTPPKENLDWDQVVEYAFLADFDLLREAREDIRQEPWALPSGRAAMEQHYKLLRANEEIQRLNLEIRRFVTYMRDEDDFLAREEGCLREEGEAGLAHQVGLLRMERARFTAVHMQRLTKLSKLGGFTGCISPGTSVSRERHVPVVRAKDVPMSPRAPSPSLPDEDVPPGEDEDEGDGDEEVNDDDGGVTDALMNILSITHDQEEARDT